MVTWSMQRSTWDPLSRQSELIYQRRRIDNQRVRYVSAGRPAHADRVQAFREGLASVMVSGCTFSEREKETIYL